MKKLLLALLFAGSVLALAPVAQAGGYSTRSYSRDRYHDDGYDRPTYRRSYRHEYYEPAYCPPPVRYYRRPVRYCPPPVYYHHRPRVGFSFSFGH